MDDCMDALVAGQEDRGGLNVHVSFATVDRNLGHVRHGILIEAKKAELRNLNSDIAAQDGGRGRRPRAGRSSLGSGWEKGGK